MVYRFRCVIARARGPEQAARIHLALDGAFPHCQTRVFHSPFLGVLSGLEWASLLESWRHDPARFDYRSEQEAHANIASAIEEGLVEFSPSLPGTALAYIDMNCSGDICLYDGFVAQDGERTQQLPGASPRGHLELLADLGATGVDVDFPPLRRGFLDAREPSAQSLETSARQLQGVMRGVGLETFV
jgi:hypothetical protein